MKRHFFITITALMAVMVSSCKKDNDELDDPNGPWSIELTTECVSSNNNKFSIELAGTGTVTIDWGDGIVLKDFPMPELKKHYDEYGDEIWPEGIKYPHVYDKVGTYAVKITGKDGTISLLSIEHDYDCDFTSIAFNQCSHLQYLDCEGTFSSIDLSKCPQLKGLFLESGYLTSLDLSRCTQLKWLVCYGPSDGSSSLKTLNISQCTQLEWLYCPRHQLTSLDVSKCTKLKILGCWRNKLTSLDISKCTKLEELACDENKLTSLDVSKCTNLKELEVTKTLLTSLDVSKCTQLERLHCEENQQLTSLNISGCTQLKELDCSENHLSVAVINKIYNDLPIVGQGMGSISVDKATAGDYYIAENKGWRVFRYN